ncbi:hypothetical protein [[Limnothrix rosea] IAM M-220]|uniref:hypothetical protein n=1 Tax=[Limnothrix rosea] IAM M-220 TaxID=454133 RepID=UPI0009657D5C|nr:hypothetical protein [[Limnothrix rosea] IAM M-220]OKH11175.1 hypothetical protein NIES208_17645 [[Limnothrix rosea] IAM M-220]
MIDTLIFAFATVYVVAAFADYSAKSICQRHKAAIAQTVSEVVEVVATVVPETITPVIELPNSIRGLRQFVRENDLQARVKEIAGKSVSNLTKGELMEAVEMALA